RRSVDRLGGKALRSAGCAGRRRHRQRRHRRRGNRREWAGSGRLGDRGNPRPADPLRQDGGQRRPGPLPGARAADSQTPGVWARALPKAKYEVWVRGYGLVDSPKVDAEPGQQLNLRAVPAPNDKEAAKYYPAIYWYSMLKIPDASQFGKKDGDIPDKVRQFDWI